MDNIVSILGLNRKYLQERADIHSQYTTMQTTYLALIWIWHPVLLLVCVLPIVLLCEVYSLPLVDYFFLKYLSGMYHKVNIWSLRRGKGAQVGLRLVICCPLLAECEGSNNSAMFWGRTLVSGLPVVFLWPTHVHAVGGVLDFWGCSDGGIE